MLPVVLDVLAEAESGQRRIAASRRYCRSLCPRSLRCLSPATVAWSVPSSCCQSSVQFVKELDTMFAPSTLVVPNTGIIRGRSPVEVFRGAAQGMPFLPGRNDLQAGSREEPRGSLRNLLVSYWLKRVGRNLAWSRFPHATTPRLGAVLEALSGPAWRRQSRSRRASGWMLSRWNWPRAWRR